MVYWLVKYVFVGPILRLFARTTVVGLENLPKDGPVLLVSNHLAVMDSFIQVLYASRKISFLAKSEYFTGTGIKGALKRWFFTAVDQVPIDRGGNSSADDAIISAVKVLDQGKVLGIYPEGTRSPDGRLYKGKTGVARIISQRHVPVIPVAMIESHLFNPPGTILPRFHKVKMIIGKPLDLSLFLDSHGDRFMERAITDKIMHSIMQLSQQEYVDMYAADMKKILSQEKKEKSQAA